ncbi:MAG: C40 family peptidase [Armatimonadota bacterium]
MFHRKLHSMLIISIIGITSFFSIPAHAETASENTGSSKTMSIPHDLLNRGLSFVGTRYRYGGTSSRGVDCSGLMKIIYQKEGIALPRSARQQFHIGKPVSSGKLSPGDLVFFNTRGFVSHVGMYIGNGKFLHAANRKAGVRVDSLGSMYYNKRFIGARRILRTA